MSGKQGLVLAVCVVVTALFGCEEAGGEMAILDLDPKVGHTNGDQMVKIVGKNFRSDIGYTVYFGTKKSKSVTILDPETLIVVTPSKVPAGSVDVMIRADDGNAFKIPGVFKFEEMGGSVVEGLGSDPAKQKDKGNLAF